MSLLEFTLALWVTPFLIVIFIIGIEVSVRLDRGRKKHLSVRVVSDNGPPTAKPKPRVNMGSVEHEPELPQMGNPFAPSKRIGQGAWANGMMAKTRYSAVRGGDRSASNGRCLPCVPPQGTGVHGVVSCLLYTSPSPRDS